MTTNCPHGHASHTSDYCDQCGAPLAGRSGTQAEHAAGPTDAPNSAVEVNVAPDTKPAIAPEPCPECQTPRVGSDRFCEGCGHNFLTREHGTRPAATSAPASEQAASWELVVEADRDYFERVATGEVEFPERYQPRRFALQDPELQIGRHSATRGTRPQIDLSGAPEDPAISHLQALLVRQDDRSYALVDPGSSNGTTLNDDPKPIAPDTPVPLADGDRIHIGAWTTMTIRGGEG